MEKNPNIKDLAFLQCNTSCSTLAGFLYLLLRQILESLFFPSSGQSPFNFSKITRLMLLCKVLWDLWWTRFKFKLNKEFQDSVYGDCSFSFLPCGSLCIQNFRLWLQHWISLPCGRVWEGHLWLALEQGYLPALLHNLALHGYIC